jgi:hypothetical protein
MGPIIRVPDDVAQKLVKETDLVEVDPVLPDAVDEVDVELGGSSGVDVLLKEDPKDGFGLLASILTMSDYAKSAPTPFELIVRDKEGNPHAFPGNAVNGQSIQDHLKLAFFGEPGDRRPLIPA